MIRLRHILHPLTTARSLFSRVQTSASNKLTNWRLRRAYRDVIHMEQLRCWCGGEIPPFKLSPNFGVCVRCGCYVNRRPPRPESLSEVYTLEGYWRIRNKARGYPPIEQRAGLYASDGRLDHWLSLVERFGPQNGSVVEVGCTPGVLLTKLQQRGYKCIGVEPDRKVAEWIQDSTGVEIRAGFFPDVSVPQCNLFMAFDVAEHAPDPVAFLEGISRVLLPDGVAILQTPIEGRNYEYPFKGRLDFFDDVEHYFLFTEDSMRKLVARAGLEIIALEDSLSSLGQVCVLRRPRLAGSPQGSALVHDRAS